MRFFKQIILAGTISGTLDILAACIQYFINTGKNPQVVFKFIASGIFGLPAFTGGNKMIWFGLLFHFLIIFIFALFFYIIYPLLFDLIKNKIASGILYGIFVWLIMHFLVVPNSKTPQLPSDLKSSIIAVGILIVCVGIPFSFMISPYRKKKILR
ncbi:MAG: hypothetical protein WKF35_03320 [Ferruginibacter sp.]